MNNFIELLVNDCRYDTRNVNECFDKVVEASHVMVRQLNRQTKWSQEQVEELKLQQAENKRQDEDYRLLQEENKHHIEEISQLHAEIAELRQEINRKKRRSSNRSEDGRMAKQPRGESPGSPKHYSSMDQFSDDE